MSSETKSNFDKVGEFYLKFGFPTAYDRPPQLIDDETFRFRRSFFFEEATEFNDAHYERDLVKVADAIGDMLYIAYGAAHFYGIDIQPVFDAIHAANMKKEARPTARSDKFDVVKPPGWVGPEGEIDLILERRRRELWVRTRGAPLGTSGMPE